MDQATIDALTTRKTTLLTEIASLAAGSSSVAGKPSYSVDGQSFDWNGARLSLSQYRKALYEELNEINKALTLAEGDWEVRDVIV